MKAAPSLLRLLACCGLLLLPACSLVSQREVVDERPDEAAEREAEEMARLGNPLLANRGDPNAVNQVVRSEADLLNIDNGAEGPVYFTDPDNPDAEIEGITQAFESRRRGNGWFADYARGVKTARREGRPIILWFHDSVTSPKSKELGRLLLETPEFGSWCEDRVVRIRFDAGAAIDDQSRGKYKYSLSTIKGMASRFGIRHRPGLVVFSPNGTIIDSIDGYDGFVAGVELQLKAAVQNAEKEFDAFRKRLSARGYRDWRSARGKSKVFAKLQRYDEAKGIVYLKEYGGRVSRTRLKEFSREDIDYLDARARDHRDKKKP